MYFESTPNLTLWKISGEASAEALIHFKNLATMAGSQLPVTMPDPLSAWLTRIKATRASRSQGPRALIESDDGKRDFGYSGIIKDLKLASVNLCAELELLAQLEEQERKRDSEIRTQLRELTRRSSVPAERPISDSRAALEASQEELRLAEVARRQDVENARALFEKKPGFPAVLVEIDENDRSIESEAPVEANQRLTEARLEHLIRFLDNRGQAYLRLIDDLESGKALTVMLDDFARNTWWQLSGVPIESIPPTSPFSKPHPTQIQRDRIMQRAKHWVIEGHRRLIETGDANADVPLSREATRSRPSESRFPRRASWTRDRLRERTFHGQPWDHNTPDAFGGPDRKTMQRILAGLPVHEGSIVKLITALNKKQIGRLLVVEDVPSD